MAATSLEFAVASYRYNAFTVGTFCSDVTTDNGLLNAQCRLHNSIRSRASWAHPLKTDQSFYTRQSMHLTSQHVLIGLRAILSQKLL